MSTASVFIHSRWTPRDGGLGSPSGLLGNASALSQHVEPVCVIEPPVVEVILLPSGLMARSKRCQACEDAEKEKAAGLAWAGSRADRQTDTRVARIAAT